MHAVRGLIEPEFLAEAGHNLWICGLSRHARSPSIPWRPAACNVHMIVAARIGASRRAKASSTWPDRHLSMGRHPREWMSTLETAIEEARSIGPDDAWTGGMEALHESRRQADAAR
jgi:hypothetical protein